MSQTAFVTPATARLYRVVKSKNDNILLNFHNLVLKIVSRNYKFHNPEGIYFVSFAVVEWLDVFTRNEYNDLLLEGFTFCQNKKGMENSCLVNYDKSCAFNF